MQLYAMAFLTIDVLPQLHHLPAPVNSRICGLWFRLQIMSSCFTVLSPQNRQAQEQSPTRPLHSAHPLSMQPFSEGLINGSIMVSYRVKTQISTCAGLAATEPSVQLKLSPPPARSVLSCLETQMHSALPRLIVLLNITANFYYLSSQHASFWLIHVPLLKANLPLHVMHII